MLKSGQSVEHYEILEKLGQGGMGQVFKARDTRLDRMVALKLLSNEKTGDQDRVARFANEARAASRLNHPNIVTIYDILLAANSHFIVMEYVDGKSLDLLIPRRGMRIDALLAIAIQIADAMAAATAAGIIHRDLKPSNVMVSHQGTAKVVDFGLAKLLSPSDPDETRTRYDDRPHQTKEGAVVGTVAYMSPEQAEGRPLDRRSDIFSFGAVLYEMLTGQRAFKGSSEFATIASILRDDPPSSDELSLGVPSDLEKIVTRCLRKDPERRFQNFADLRVELIELQDELAAGSPTKSGESNRSGFWWKIGAALLGIALAASLAFQHFLLPEAKRLDARVAPLTSYAGFQGYPAFSPDGNQTVFAWNGGQGSVTHLYVKLIGTETQLKLTTGSKSDFSPAWAPNGRTIAFIRSLSMTKTGIYSVDPFGGQERLVAELVASPYQALSWSSDGKWLAVSGRLAAGQRSGILAVSVETGQVRPISFGVKNDEFYPALSRDGKHLAFTRLLGEGNWAIFVVRLKADLEPEGSPVRLNTPFGLNRQPAWTTDGKELIVANGGTVNTHLWRVSAHDQSAPQELSILGDVAYQPAVAPQGNRLVYAHDFNNANIWKADILGEGRLGQPTLVVDSPRSSWIRPNALSPDGQKIAFESNRSGPYGIWTANMDGSKAELTFGSAGYSSGSPAWSPDNQTIAFDTRIDKIVEIYTVSAQGGTPRRVTSLQSENLLPSWSHDGKWIYFVSNRSGRFEIFKISPEGGNEAQLTHNGGWAPQESPDGRTLFYNRTRAVSTPLLSVSLSGGPENTVLPAVHERWWVVSSKGVWFLQGEAPGIDPGFWMMEVASTERGSIRYLSFGQNRTFTAASLPKGPASGVAISQNGKSLLYNQVDHRATELLLVENFR